MSEIEGMLNSRRLVTELATRHGVHLDEHDPAVTIVILNRLALENMIGHLDRLMAARIAAFDASLEKAERRAGNILALQVKESCAQIRSELQADICAAALKAERLVSLVDRAHRRSSRPVKFRWFVLGLVATLLISSASFAIGLCTLR